MDENKAIDKHGRRTERSGCAELSAVDLIRLIWDYRRMICLLSCASALCVGVLVYRRPRTYAASTSIVPPIDVLQKQSELSGGFGLGGKSWISKVMGVTSIADMYVGILESRTVADMLIQELITGNSNTSKALAIHRVVVATAMAAPLDLFGNISDSTTQVIGASDMAYTARAAIITPRTMLPLSPKK